MTERKRTKPKEPAKLEPSEPIVGLTVDQVAARLQLNRMTVIRLLQSGKLVGIKVGRPWRVHPAAIDQYLMQGQRTEIPGNRPELKGQEPRKKPAVKQSRRRK
jgi:excisionase family DNA binding protein